MGVVWYGSFKPHVYQLHGTCWYVYRLRVLFSEPEYVPDKTVTVTCQRGGRKSRNYRATTPQNNKNSNKGLLDGDIYSVFIVDRDKIKVLLSGE